MLLKQFKFRYFCFFLLLIEPSIISADEPILNSERIEEKFGSYGVDIIKKSNEKRISFLFSYDKKNSYKKIYHTLAIVSYYDSSNLGKLQTQIDNGASIGSTLKKDGWNIQKKHIQIGQIRATTSPILDNWLDSRSKQKLAVHLYKLIIVKKDLVIDYADIIEIHHPKYISPDELKMIYPIKAANISDQDIDNIISKQLKDDSIKNAIDSLLKH